MILPPLDSTTVRNLVCLLLAVRSIYDPASAESARCESKVSAVQAAEDLEIYLFPVVNTPVPVEVVPEEFRSNLVEALGYLPILKELTKRTTGSYRSKAIEQYQISGQVERFATTLEIESLTRLLQVEHLSSEISGRLDDAWHNCRVQTGIFDYLVQRFGTNGELQEPMAVRKLFKALFEAPLPVESLALDLVLSNGQILFLLDYEGEQICDEEQWNSLSPVEQRQVSTFLVETQSSAQKFGAFPGFGPFSPSDFSAEFCEDCAKALTLPVWEVRQLLSSSCNILPLKNADLFLLHDTRGHYWQGIFARHLGADYGRLPSVAQPIEITEFSYVQGKGPLSIRELFQVTDQGVVTLNESLVPGFYQGILAQRLGWIASHIVGELMADLVDTAFRLSVEDSVAHTISSSVFPEQAIHLDLSILDLDMPFQQSLNSIADFGVLRGQLVRFFSKEHGLEEVCQHSLDQSLARMAELFLAEQKSRTDLLSENAGEVYSALFFKVLANIVSIRNTINEVFGAPKVLDSQYELLWVTVACCMDSEDSLAAFGRLDYELSNYFLPLVKLIADSF